ncbi:hypothetical protein [Flavobacterium selenitireducens]|uniref:hypothetical protein n=1 Tax=Flavobacterium selenitireducens TaxID=2722704 RepID=UPI00168B36D4|nr:hypothetical protein [Flavobacterium selenitireducens]MBD3580961.1 hypothetical protein [Flavobacterium selenitireducens]
MRGNFVLAAVFVSFTGFVQGQDVMKAIGDDSCACISELRKSGQEVTDMQLGLCIVKSYNARKSQLPPEKQVSLSDSEAFEAIAAEIGIKMVETCPDFIMDMADDNINETSEAAEARHSMNVQITDVKSEQFVTITAKDENGRQHSLLMLEYFGTASLFTEGKVKKGDKITIAYKEVELYDPKMKEFRYYKVITDLTK